MRLICAWVMITIALASMHAQENSMPESTVTRPQLSWMDASSTKLDRELIGKYGEAQRARLERGLHQVSESWRPEAGDAAAYEEFVSANFASDQATLDTTFNRFERLLEQLGGHMHEINREFRQQMDLDLGPVLPFDEMFGGYDPSAHIIDDFFQNKLAFVVLLNFPLTTLEERLKEGPSWTRRQWTEVRLAQKFSKRIPADVNLGIAQAEAAAARYVAEYNIWMHHLLDENGQRLFPPKMRLLSHWNLRDEIKADYADKQNGLAKQRMIQQVMGRIVTQTIPAVAVNNPNVDWNPFTNEAKLAAVKDSDSPVPASMNINSERELDAIVAKKYPTAEAYQRDIPNLLVKLGFSPERAQYVAQHIVIEPARGSGHAMGAEMRAEKAHLRTRVGKSGMNYKGFNIAVHEMGHNVEQTFSLNDVDHTLLKGVPNTAFTEALAFVFQGRDLQLLGLPAPDARSEAEKTLNDFWTTYEIAGVGLVDTAVWHWMYDHAQATPSQLNAATLQIAKDIWNRYYAPVFHQKDVVLLAVYSHMIDSFLYLPDYSIGHLIAAQIEEQMKKAGAIGPEFERIAKMGDVTPDLWMENASGKPVGPDALLEATKWALSRVQWEATHRSCRNCPVFGWVIKLLLADFGWRIFFLPSDSSTNRIRYRDRFLKTELLPDFVRAGDPLLPKITWN